MTIAFTVVMPTYNRGDLIAETLDAVLAQTHPASEIIVIDGGSTDNTKDVVARYAGKVTYKEISDRSAQAKRNQGIGLTKTEWIAFCDSDDIWLPDYLEKQAALIAAEPGIAMTFGNFQILRNGMVEAGTKFDDAPAGYWDSVGVRRTPQGWIFGRSLAGASLRFHPIFPSAMVVTKALAVAVGGFNSNLPMRVEDGEFTLRCLYRAKSAALPQALVRIRKHDANVSRELVPRLLDEVTTLQHAKATHAEAHPYHHIIDDEIAIRTEMAFNAAFCSKDHALTAALFEKLPAERRSFKIRVKNAISRLPDFLGRPLNASLQFLAGGRAYDSGLR
jgi:glycosyltransferase involved in cell wall biosynthesis